MAPNFFEKNGHGLIRLITGTNPAAGAEVSEAVPAGVRWRILTVEIILVAEVTAAVRTVELAFDDGANVYFDRKSPADQAASETREYHFSPVGYTDSAFIDTDIVLGIPPLILPAGHRIRTITNNLQSGDDFSAPLLLVEEWDES